MGRQRNDGKSEAAFPRSALFDETAGSNKSEMSALVKSPNVVLV
jgi:hypothetical protein